jgi:hypothetical protein
MSGWPMDMEGELADQSGHQQARPVRHRHRHVAATK